jgi:RNA polymerase sigma factor (sigma-70 family)
MDRQLTKRQQDLVAKNHNLIYQFAKDKKLPIDEYYDILAIGLCKAAKVYDEKKGEFSTIAYSCMRNMLSNHFRDTRRKRDIPKEMILYYDATYTSNDSENKNDYLNSLSCDRSTYDIVSDNMIITTFFNMLNQKEKAIVKLLIIGLSQKEIAQKLQCKAYNIQHAVSKIRKKYLFISNGL